MNLISESDGSKAIPVIASAPYPRERIPKQALLSCATFSEYSNGGIPSVLDAGNALRVNRGCMALGLALQHAQVGANHEVLLPAYHCISMVEPVVWRNAQPVFYKVNFDTTIDLNDIEAQLTANTRALLVAHYFGFTQDMMRIRAFCDTHKLLLIEDCAHAFFGSIGGKPIGSFGNYAIASTWKFFPVTDGGLLVSASKDLSDLKLQAPSLWSQAKAVVNTIEQAYEHQRMPIAGMLLKGPMRLKQRIAKGGQRDAPAYSQTESAPDVGAGGWGFDAALIRRKMSLFSQGIASLASKPRITQGRRRNYAKMLAALGNLPGGKPLFPTLPEGVVPQVFPLLMDDPARMFALLKYQGVPIIRFGEFRWPAMPATRCVTSAELSRRVFQFPCHQDLMPDELDWMIGCIRDTLLLQHDETGSPPQIAVIGH